LSHLPIRLTDFRSSRLVAAWRPQPPASQTLRGAGPVGRFCPLHPQPAPCGPVDMEKGTLIW
jgi:hypothetical protein